MRYEDTRVFDPAAFNRLVTSTSIWVRSRTMLAAGRIGDPAAVNLLVHGLGDPADSVITYAAFGLGELADSSAYATQALGRVAAGNGGGAAEAIAALGKIGAAGGRPYVEAVLRSNKTGDSVREALLAIWRFPRQPATSALVRPFTTSPDPEIRWRAVYALTRGGPDPANVPAFRHWLHDADPLVRAVAARGLRAVTVDSAGERPASAAALIEALADSIAHVRISAAQVLGQYRDPAHAEATSRLLADADLNVRIAAIQALGQMKGPTAAAALQARVADTAERPTLRGMAFTSLVSADQVAGLARASELARSPDWLLRLYTARALANAKSTAAFDLVRTLARDSDVRVRGPAVAAAGSIAGDTLQSARAFFIEQLAATDPFTRAEALGALQRLASPGDEVVVMEAFEFALRDSVEDAAIAAIGVLAKLAEQNPAIQRSFAARFPLSRIPFSSVRRLAIRELKIEEACCPLPARPEVYERVVRTLLAPALRGAPLPRVRINTSAGSFELELLAADAPLTVDNFMTLVGKKYFDGGRWHRVVPNFVLQDGDPTGTGSGGPGYAIRDELNRVRYLRGTLGMALSGPDTGGSQFFVTHSPQPHLDGGYTVFGSVVSGMDVADQVIQDDPIISLEVMP
jgi:cyclophilin family peptidyl-prolyl cis-trans isomerase/HEAT repeat protein